MLSTYDGELRDPLCWPQERPVPLRVARGPLGIPLPSMPGPKTLCGSVAQPEDSSPVLTWILGFFWSLHRGVSPRLEWGHETALYSRAVAAESLFPSRGSGDLWLSLEAFPRGFPRGFPIVLSHGPPWCASILGLKVEAVLGKQVSLEWTVTSGGLWERWHDPEFLSPFLWRASPLEMRWERREFFPEHAGKGSHLSSKEAETGLLWIWAELSCFLSSGDGYVGELLELLQGCEGLFGSSRC